jgi:hypothetical protein
MTKTVAKRVTDAQQEWGVPALSPAGRLHLTLTDWSRFVRLFLVGIDGGGVLTPASVQRLLTVRPGENYAMGWAQGQEFASFVHQGSNTAWLATAMMDRDRRRAALVTINDTRKGPPERREWWTTSLEAGSALFGPAAMLAGQLLRGPQ